MKSKHFFFSLFILIGIFAGLKLFNPVFVNAACPEVACVPPFRSGCFAESSSCDNGQCQFAWNCTDSCSGGWTDWSSCVGGYQTRDCTSASALYQIQRCGASCFLPGTIVNSSQGGKKIEDVKLGDRVASFANNKVTNSSVSKIYKVRRDYYYSLSAEDYKVKATAEHPFYVGDDKYKEIKDLVTGDSVYVIENEKLTKKIVTENIRINEETDAYNLSVDNTNTFFANNFAVHNKGGTGDPGRGPDCPANTTINLNDRINRFCLSDEPYWGWWKGFYINGTAQNNGECCKMSKGGKICGDWYSCPTPNNPGKMCRDCEDIEPECKQNYTDTYSCSPVCNTTSPYAFAYSANVLSWTTGSNGTSQKLYVSKVLNDVNNDCGAGTTCTVNTSLGVDTTSYTFSPVLTAGTIYYVKLINYKDSSCSSSVVVSFPTPVPYLAWWQVKNGDLTSGGNVYSLVPSGLYFNTIGSGGFSGIPVYNGGLYVDPGNISTDLWNANTYTAQERTFNYSYFKNLIPDDVTKAGIYPYLLDGYKWTLITGDYTLGTTDFSSTKNILFIDGDLTINGNIDLTDDLGFFVVFVSGSIKIDPTVTKIKGLYLTDNILTTGIGTSQFHLRGSMVARTGVSLERDLIDNTIPAELFEFAPDQVSLFPEKLGFRGQRWAEVAP